MTKANFTNDQLIELHKNYISGTSIMELSKLHKCSYNSIFNGFKRLQLEIIPQSKSKRKFPIREDFFSIIDSEEKAYILGFIYADGCNHSDKNKLEISLAKQDEEILVKFSKILLFGNNQVKEYSRKGNRENKVGLYIVNKQISQDLIHQGCPARKTFILKYPKIPLHLYSHFVRGYFDGDGMLVIYERIAARCKNISKTAEFSITSTKEMLNEISNIFAILGVSTSINKRHKNRDNNNYTLRVFGNQQIKTVCDYLYKNASIFLNRKHIKYIELCEMSKTFRKKYVK